MYCLLSNEGWRLYLSKKLRAFSSNGLWVSEDFWIWEVTLKGTIGG